MITINTTNKYSNKVYLRYITPCFVILLLFSLVVGKTSDILAFFIVLSIFIGIPYSVFFIIRIKSYSFIITENNITQNYGIITKKSETITFDKIQNIESFSNIINRLFGLTQLNIWTASLSQEYSRRGTSQNEPNIFLLLEKADANWIKKYILDKTVLPNQVAPISTGL